MNKEELREGAYGLLSLSEKTRKSNHLQMQLKAALSTQLPKDPECWFAQGSNPRPPAR